MTNEKKKPAKKLSYRQRKLGKFVCHCCKKELPYCLSCPCGFMICEECFKENIWGISNGPTWVCPDCERIRMT
jgi:Zn-finger protein